MRQLIIALGWLSPFVPIVLWPHTHVYGFVIMALLHALWLYPTLSPNVRGTRRCGFTANGCWNAARTCS